MLETSGAVQRPRKGSSGGRGAVTGKPGRQSLSLPGPLSTCWRGERGRAGGGVSERPGIESGLSTGQLFDLKQAS